MFAIERRRKIIDIVAETQSISVSELSRRLGVTVVTIRKDLESLENDGLVTRTYGGVILGGGLKQTAETPEREGPVAYSAGVAAAAKMIAQGQTVMMGRGRTVVELADFIKDYENLTVITISLEVALVLGKAPGIDVILTGGILRPRTMTMLGHLAERVIREISFDLSFSEADGIHAEAGVTSANLVEASTESVMLETSKYPVIFADGAAVGRIASTALIGLKPEMAVIISGGPDKAALGQLRARGLNLILPDDRLQARGEGHVD